MKKRGFTLTEVLIMLAVLGILATIAIVSIANIRPNQDAIKLRKAYATIEQTVQSLMDDTELYPILGAFMLERTGIYGQMQAAQDILQDNIKVDGGGGGGGGGWVPPQSCPEGEILQNGSCIADPAIRLDINCLERNPYTGACVNCESGYILDKSTDKCVRPTPPVILPPPTPPTPPVTPPVTPPPVPPVVTEPPTVSTDFGTEITLASGNNTSGYRIFSAANNLKIPSGAPYTAQNKFAYNFGKKLETTAPPSCSGRVCTFETVDGMSWTVTDGFSANSDNFSTITVDVNGVAKKPNITTGNKPDTFTFNVYPTGKITITGGTAQKYLTTRKVKEKDLK